MTTARRDVASVKRSTVNREFLLTIHQTRATDEKRAYHRAVATRLVILISAHDLIVASRMDGRTDGRTDGRDREKKRGRGRESVSFVRVERDGAGEREREAEEGEEKDIERCRDVLLPRPVI